MRTIKQIFKWYVIGLAIAVSITLLLFFIDYFFGNIRIYAETQLIISLCFKSAFFFGFSALSLSEAFKD
jgi:hypothetical protein